THRPSARLRPASSLDPHVPRDRRRSAPEPSLGCRSQPLPREIHVALLSGGQPENSECQRGEGDAVDDVLTQARPFRAAMAAVALQQQVPGWRIELAGGLDELLARVADL